MRNKVRLSSREPPDAAVARVADGQAGVISALQMGECGLSAYAIRRRAHAGRLIRVHRGVYAVGHRHLKPEGHRWAAVLACGQGAVLSGRSAAEHWGLRKDARQRFEITVPRTSGGGPKTIQVHRRALTATDVTTFNRIPTTTVARTLLDLAAAVPQQQLIEAIDQAIRLNLYDQAAIDALLAPGRGRGRGGPGVKALRHALTTRHPDSHHTRSRLERDALDRLAAHGLRTPQTNVWLPDLNVEVDLLWPVERLAVELDGYEHHRSRTAFEHDRAKTAELQAAGYAVLRFTHRQLHEDPGWVTARIAEQLDRGGKR